MGATFQYATPGVSCEKLCNFIDWAHAMLNSKKFFLFLRNDLLADAANAVRLLKNDSRI